VLVYDDQTAELADAHSRLVVGRVTMFKIGQKPAELGYDPADLVPD
jgi:hypothetical protein